MTVNKHPPLSEETGLSFFYVKSGLEHMLNAYMATLEQAVLPPQYQHSLVVKIKQF